MKLTRSTTTLPHLYTDQPVNANYGHDQCLLGFIRNT